MAIEEEGTKLGEIEARLRARAPVGLRELSADELADLLEVIDDARRNQAAELREAGDRAFGHVPWILRGPIRRIMR